MKGGFHGAYGNSTWYLVFRAGLPGRRWGMGLTWGEVYSPHPFLSTTNFRTGPEIVPVFLEKCPEPLHGKLHLITRKIPRPRALGKPKVDASYKTAGHGTPRTLSPVPNGEEKGFGEEVVRRRGFPGFIESPGFCCQEGRKALFTP